MEVQDKQKAQSKTVDLLNRESVKDELFDANRLLEDVLERNNMLKAMYRVIINKGSYGIDGMKADELWEHVKKTWVTVKATVQDRMIQQAIAQILSKLYEPTFSESSFGFRSNRGAKNAIKQSETYINQGYKWVVDMELEKFFDKVNHNILMGKLEKKIKDKRLLKLIRKYLESGVLINGIKVSSEEGTAQGGPLSPLLAIIILDDVGKELEKRGHKFCRYADDCNIYVKSKRAGLRVMDSITRIIENERKLKVNKDKSAVDVVSKRKFLGFSFYFIKGVAKIRIHEKWIKIFKEKVKSITNRNRGISMDLRLLKLNASIKGWINYFGIANAKRKLLELDIEI